VGICRISANGAIIAGILHRNRKAEFYRVFLYWQIYLEGKWSLKWAYYSLESECH
jgi:hypothetical protein